MYKGSYTGGRIQGSLLSVSKLQPLVALSLCELYSQSSCLRLTALVEASSDGACVFTTM